MHNSNQRQLRAVLVAVSVLAAASLAYGERPRVYALKNARTVVIRDGLIEAVGADTAVPRDAVEIDATGKTVYPGPAQILGVGDKLGSIEVGKSASLVLTSGDLLEIRTKILAEYIDGHPVDLNNNKHYKLYQKYANRPKVK